MGGGRPVLPSHQAFVSHGYMGSGMVMIPGLRPDLVDLFFSHSLRISNI